MMEILIWVGTAATLTGFIGLVYCILRAMRARKAGLDDDAMRDELRRLVIFNMAAFGISALGLALVIMGVILTR
ncbi:MAG: hypothetical protein ACK5M4_00480 [Pseudorhodobacter sp.]